MPTITHQQVNDILDCIGDATVEPRTYSGRGMRGRTCFGITVDGPDDLIAFILAAGQVLEDPARAEWGFDPDDTLRLFRNCSEDSMGLQRIYYWPRLTYDVEADRDALDADEGDRIAHEIRDEATSR